MARNIILRINQILDSVDSKITMLEYLLKTKPWFRPPGQETVKVDKEKIVNA